MGKGKLLVLILLSLAQFILTLDSTFMNVSISTLVKDLDTTVTAIQGAIAFYSLVMATFMIAGAKVGDIIGRKRAFIIGLIIYAVGSFITSISWNVQVLIFGWSFLEGIGAALVMPALLAMVVGNFDAGVERVKAYGILAAIAASGAALGPIIGGFLTTYVSWRIGFFGEVLVALFIIIMRKRIKDAAVKLADKSFDIMGLILSGGGFAVLVFGILLSNSYGIFVARKPFYIGNTMLINEGSVSPTIWFVLIGIGVIFLFLLWEYLRIKKAKTVLVHPKILRIGSVSWGILTTMSTYFVMAGVIFTVSIISQIILQYSAFEAGLVLLPFSLSVLIVALFGGRLANKFYPKHLIQVGIGTVLAGAFLLGALTANHPNSNDFIISLFMIGAGVGLVVSQLNNLILSSVPPEESSEASGLSSTFLNLGNSLGTAISGSLIIAVFITASIGLVETSSAFTQNQKDQLTSKIEVTGQTLSNAELSKYLTGVPEEQANEILSINNQAEIKATAAASVSLGVLGAFGLLTASFLPKKRLEEKKV